MASAAPKSFTQRSSISDTLNVVGDIWMLRLLGALFTGTNSWSGLAERLNVSPSTLSTRLKQLVAAGCAERCDGQGYILRQRGAELLPIILVADEWRLRWDNADETALSPWLHRCGHPLRCRSACSRCDEDILLEHTQFEPRNDQVRPKPDKPRHFRSSATTLQPASDRQIVSRVLLALGDRRASLMLAPLFRSRNRFDEIEAWTGLHPAIISERVRKLQLLELAHMRLYQEHPDRYVYALSAAGRDLFPSTLQMLHWGDKWFYGNKNEPVLLTHRRCGERLRGIVKCVRCETEVLAGDLQVREPDAQPFLIA